MKYKLYVVKRITDQDYIAEIIADTTLPNVTQSLIVYPDRENFKIPPTPFLIVYKVDGFEGTIELEEPYGFNETEKYSYSIIEKKIYNTIRKHKLKLLDKQLNSL